MLSREAAIEAAKEAAKKVRRKKKRTASSTSLASNTFQELYRLTGEVLGQGAYASVQTCVNIYTEVEYNTGSLYTCSVENWFCVLGGVRCEDHRQDCAHPQQEPSV